MLIIVVVVDTTVYCTIILNLKAIINLHKGVTKINYQQSMMIIL